MATKSKARKSLAEAAKELVGAGSQAEGALYDALDRLGVNQRVAALRARIDEMDVRRSVKEAQDYLSEQIDSARDYARENPGKVIGGAAGVLVGASLLAYALSRKPAAPKRKKTSSPAKKKTAKKKRSR